MMPDWQLFFEQQKTRLVSAGYGFGSGPLRTEQEHLHKKVPGSICEIVRADLGKSVPKSPDRCEFI
jgi:hypothetical protein